LDRAHLLGVAFLPMCSTPRLHAPGRRYPPSLPSSLFVPPRVFQEEEEEEEEEGLFKADAVNEEEACCIHGI